MRIIHTGSKWGNLYNFRYFIDGMRVTEGEWITAHDRAMELEHTQVTENTSYGFRTVTTTKGD